MFVCYDIRMFLLEFLQWNYIRVQNVDWVSWWKIFTTQKVKRIIHIRSPSHDAKFAQHSPQNGKQTNRQQQQQQWRRKNTRMIKINADILSIFGVFHVEHVRTHRNNFAKKMRKKSVARETQNEEREKFILQASSTKSNLNRGWNKTQTSCQYKV